MRPFQLTAAVLLACLTAAALPWAYAQDPYVISLTPVLTPWPADNSTVAYQAGSAVAELNLAHVYLGPCTYRMMHLHITADELFMVVAGRVESSMVAPNNTVYNHSMTAGSNVVYPKGWMHSQYNPTCQQGHATIVFNAKSIGTVNIPTSLGVASEGYLRAAYGIRPSAAVPTVKGLWVVDSKCAAACKLKV